MQETVYPFSFKDIMRVQVHKCRVTGKIFEDKNRAKYILHLKNIRARQKELRLHERIRDEFPAWLTKERSEIYDPEDIIPWFLKNQRYIMDAANAITFANHDSYEKFQPADRFDDLKYERIRYNPFVSNSHSCPDNGVQNWGGKDMNPKSYPGWEGHIIGKLLRPPKHNSSYPYGEALNIVGIKTGSGGGGNESWGYDIKLFLDDWTGLGQILTLNKLRGI